MKRLIVVLLLSVFPWRLSQEALPFFDTPVDDQCIEVTIDYFDVIYPVIRAHEGSYVNHPKDRGKETYAGITRRYNPEWEGWMIIDSIKNQCGSISRFTRIEQVEPLVEQYYRHIWDNEQSLHRVSDINLAYYLFDMRIHHNSFDRLLSKTLNQIGYDSIGSGDDITLLIELRNTRIKLFQSIVTKDPSQKVFLKGWLKRAKKISIDS